MAFSACGRRSSPSHRVPQIIHSVKRFAGPTGLEEYVGRGIGMALDVSVEEGALVFRSRHYFLQLRGRRLRLPGWLGPGRVRVAHEDLGEGAFRFSLDVTQPRLGLAIRQVGIYEDRASPRRDTGDAGASATAML